MEGKNGELEVKVVIDWSDVTVQSFPLPFESSAGVCKFFALSQQGCRALACLKAGVF